MKTMSEISAVAPEASVAPTPGPIPRASDADDLKQLRAVFGQDEANHGTTRYSVDANGLVQVPRDAMEPLISVRGFVLVKTVNDTISVGSLNLRNDNAAGCSYAGRQYLGDANGNVIVPAEAAPELVAHGFVPIADEMATARSRAISPTRYRRYKG